MAFLSTLVMASVRTTDRYQLTSPLIYQHKEDVYVVPAGFETDLASVPNAIKFIVDDDEADIREAAVVHDWLYSTKAVPRKKADEILFRAMIELGAGYVKAHIVYWAVRLFGGSHYA